jgi:hypothetical protein
MPSQKLVRCEIGRAGNSGGSVRFIPLDIFGMWKYLMLHKHQFEVRAAVPSLWVELEEAGGMDLEEGRIERVTEVRLYVFNDRDSMLSEVCRYVPTDEIDEVRPVLLKHYDSSSKEGGQERRWRERQGIWFRPRREEELPADSGAPTPSA